MVDPVNERNRKALLQHVRNMDYLKPEKGDPDYANKIKKWREALTFSKDLMNAVNDINNTVVLAGKPNTSKVQH